MGKGDLKSKRGKISRGTSGVTRQKKKAVIETKPKKKTAAKKTTAKKTTKKAATKK